MDFWIGQIKERIDWKGEGENMVRQKPWDQYEAAILLEATIKVHDGQLDRKNAIIEVSKSLRRKAKLEGLEIDEIFRNEAGITFQMYSMESAYLGYVVRKKPATKLFTQIVMLRMNDRERFEKILEEAKTMSDVDGRKQITSVTLVNTTEMTPKTAVHMKLSEAESKRYSKILKEHFGEGLVLNAIRLDKFRMLYEDEFGTEPSDDDDQLTDQLKMAGIYIDGRIYPKQEHIQNDLLNEIRDAVRSVLDSGGSCVYIRSVMERWQQPLADQLNIYNEVALRDLIIAEDMSGLYATNRVFKTTHGRVSPEQDVLEYMKDCHVPVRYEELQRKLWYLPIDVIKHALVTTPALVQVDWETYMYAPNFPASSVELQYLVEMMKTKIKEKGFLVAKDIAQLIKEKCPTIAINTEGYKDWAYRNILRYVLRDCFEFGSSVVSEKGKKLEMRQVYRGFCRDYERLTFDELKQFSSEVGVQIYWDDVLQEMVRINQNEMIRRDLIHFDIDAIDNILDELCQGDYLPIKQVGLFLHFPTMGYPWNSYVLESYLQYSKRFQLYHANYSYKGVYGLVVRRNSALSNYRQVVVDMLANSNEWTDINSALALIVEKGCQARKRWKGFDKVIQEALVRREEIFMERK